MGRLPEDYGLSRPYSVPANGKPFYAEDFGKIEKGQWYFKIERSTGLTGGLCHRKKQVVNALGRTRVDHKEVEVDVSVVLKETLELLIISYDTKKCSAQLEQNTFCVMGDSGSFFIDRSGRVV